MLITKEIKIDLVERIILPPVNAVQCDSNTRAVAVTLTAAGVDWEPPAGTNISVAFRKPDGKNGWYDKLPDGSDACSVSGNVVTAILAPEVLTAAGQVDVVIVFNDGNLNQLATFGFTVEVEKNPAAGTAISNDYYNLAPDYIDDSTVGDKAWSSKKIVEEMAGVIVCEASGKVIKLADVSDRPLRSLRFSTEFSGTTSLYRFRSKNLINIDAMLNDGLTQNDNGTYRMKKLTDDAVNYSAKQETFIPQGTYAVSVSDNYVINSIDGTGYLYLRATYENGGYFTGRVLQQGYTHNAFNFEDNVVGLELYIYPAEDANSNVVFSKLQLEPGNVNTDYEDYQEPQIDTVTVTNGQVETTLTLEQDTYVFNGLGDTMQVCYLADTKAYIDNKKSTPGADGKNGVTFTPSVSEDGDLSWSNDGGLENPATVNIKGPMGDTPKKGTDYFTDEDKAEMVAAVLAAMPAAEEVSF